MVECRSAEVRGSVLRKVRPELDRAVGLRGAAAAEWFSGLGFTDVQASDLRLVADAYRDVQIAFARVWRSASAYSSAELEEEHPLGPGIAITIVTDGDLTVSVPHGELTLHPGDAVLRMSSQVLAFENRAPVASIELEAGGLIASRFGSGSDPSPQHIEAGSPTLRAASVLVNELLSSAPSSPDPLSGRKLIAVEALVTDLLDHSLGDRVTGVTPATRHLIWQAKRIIAASYSTPSFSVRDLARQMNVTERRLQMAFSAIGTTPLTELRFARASAAEMLIRTYDGVTRAELEEIAERVGLRGSRAVKDHLAAFRIELP